MGTWTGLAAWAGIMAGVCAAAAVLLWTTPTGRVDWRNMLAAWVLPWGYRVSPGSLAGIAAISWSGFVVTGLGAVLVGPPDLRGPAAEAEPGVLWRYLFAAVLLIDGTALAWMTGAEVDSRLHHGGRARLGKPFLIIGGVTAAGIWLWLNGSPVTAVVVMGAPAAIVGAGYGLLLAVFMAAGKNARWN